MKRVSVTMGRFEILDVCDDVCEGVGARLIVKPIY